VRLAAAVAAQGRLAAPVAARARARRVAAATSVPLVVVPAAEAEVMAAVMAVAALSHITLAAVAGPLMMANSAAVPIARMAALNIGAPIVGTAMTFAPTNLPISRRSRGPATGEVPRIGLTGLEPPDRAGRKVAGTVAIGRSVLVPVPGAVPSKAAIVGRAVVVRIG
jgi:hypothetical protein